MTSKESINQDLTSNQHNKNIIDLLNQNCYSKRMHDVFRDFVAMSAIAISNAIDKVHFKDREAAYMKIVQKYTKEEALRFSHAFAELVMVYEKGGFDDVLGKLYMSLELGNEKGGQFFTPYHVCRMMAKISGPSKDSTDKAMARHGFIKANDPCVGAGAMIIALAQEMKEANINYQQCLYVMAMDIDITAVYMAYIQFSLFHIPAVIVWGDTLTLEEWGHWYTPAHFMGCWHERLEAAKRIDKMLDAMNEILPPAKEPLLIAEPPTDIEPEPVIEAEPTIAIISPQSGEQITLF